MMKKVVDEHILMTNNEGKSDDIYIIHLNFHLNP